VIEGVVDFDEVEDFGVGLEGGLIWNFEVGPAAGANKKIRQTQLPTLPSIFLGLLALHPSKKER